MQPLCGVPPLKAVVPPERKDPRDAKGSSLDTTHFGLVFVVSEFFSTVGLMDHISMEKTQCPAIGNLTPTSSLCLLIYFVNMEGPRVGRARKSSPLPAPPDSPQTGPHQPISTGPHHAAAALSYPPQQDSVANDDGGGGREQRHHPLCGLATWGPGLIFPATSRGRNYYHSPSHSYRKGT